MFFVLYGHLCPAWNQYFVFTSPIKIPLFFAITGYVFNDRNGNVKIFLKNLFLKLCIPWIVLSLLPLKLIKAFAIDHSAAVMWQYFWDFLSGDTLWYMPCCIIAEIITFLIRKIMKDKVKGVTITSLLISVFGYVIAMYGVLGFAGMDTACIAQLYILMGYLFKKYENRLKEKAIAVCSFTCILYVLLGIITLSCYPEQALDVHANTYYNVVICLLMILCGCIFLFTAVNKMDVKGRVIAFVGKNTLVFYMLNPYAFKIIYMCIQGAGIKEMENPISWMVMTVAASVICGALAIVINRYLPEIVGKKRNTI